MCSEHCRAKGACLSVSHCNNSAGAGAGAGAPA